MILLFRKVLLFIDDGKGNSDCQTCFKAGTHYMSFLSFLPLLSLILQAHDLKRTLPMRDY